MSYILACQPIMSYYEKTGKMEEIWQKEQHTHLVEEKNANILEDKVELGIAIHKALIELTSDWNKSPGDWNRETILQVAELFSRWIRQSEAILERIKQCEAKGFQIEMVDEFLERLLATKAIPLDVDGIQHRFDNAAVGGTLLDDAFNELLADHQ